MVIIPLFGLTILFIQMLINRSNNPTRHELIQFSFIRISQPSVSSVLFFFFFEFGRQLLMCVVCNVIWPGPLLHGVYMSVWRKLGVFFIILFPSSSFQQQHGVICEWDESMASVINMWAWEFSRGQQDVSVRVFEGQQPGPTTTVEEYAAYDPLFTKWRIRSSVRSSDEPDGVSKSVKRQFEALMPSPGTSLGW